MKLLFPKLTMVLACGCAPAPQSETPRSAGATPAPPPPASAAPAASADAPPATASEATPATTTQPSSAPAPAATEPPPPSDPKLSRPPKAILTASEVAFVIDYGTSDAGKTAQDTCSERSEGDPEKLAACKTKARDEFTADVLHFKKRQGADKWSLYIYKRKGSNLTQVYTAPVDFADEADHTITIQLKGGEGTLPLFRGANKFVVALPNDYSIVLQDPKHGRLVYDAKIGLVGH